MSQSAKVLSPKTPDREILCPSCGEGISLREALRTRFAERFELEISLRRSFPQDLIEPVTKSVKGGDIIHKVMAPSGQVVGTIIWEAKNKRSWPNTFDDYWIDRIKETQRTIVANYAIIVSDVLPKSIDGMLLHYGVWVCETRMALNLARALRASLLDGLDDSQPAGTYKIL